ncbi:MAG: M43 family zinc metalloprotease [Alphaproteobacteria bacterium]|nr:M43 family zinc metalloprotease [Alphaproteobacteria bacterium]
MTVYQSLFKFPQLLAHELGHSLNLLHTFQGSTSNTQCPVNNDCNTDGDGCCDTPPVTNADCYSTSICSSGDLTNSTQNIMSYCQN